MTFDDSRDTRKLGQSSQVPEVGDCLSFGLFGGSEWGGAIVAGKGVAHGHECLLTVVTRIHQRLLPSAADFLTSDVLSINYDALETEVDEVYVLRIESYPHYAHLFRQVARVGISDQVALDLFCYCGDGWSGIAETVERQLEWERTEFGPKRRVRVADFLVAHS